MQPNKEIRNRLEYLRKQIENECISYGEIAELQNLKDHIEDGDILLKEWAGVDENDDSFEPAHSVDEK